MSINTIKYYFKNILRYEVKKTFLKTSDSVKRINVDGKTKDPNGFPGSHL